MARSTRLIIDGMNLVHRAYHTSAEKLGVGFRAPKSEAAQNEQRERERLFEAAVDEPEILLPEKYSTLDGARPGFRYPTGVLYISFTSYMAWLRRFIPDQVVFVWDGRRDLIWRKQIDPLYKANRSDADSLEVEEAWRRTVLYEVECKDVKTMVKYSGGINVESPDGFEADDCISALSRHFTASEYVRNIIISTDSDLIQLVKPFECSVYNPIKKAMYSHDVAQTIVRELREADTPPTLEEYAKNTLAVVTAKALLGDTSDNIKGIDGCGKVTALQLADAIYDCDITTLNELRNPATWKRVAAVNGLTGRSIRTATKLATDTETRNTLYKALLMIDLHADSYAAIERKLKQRVTHVGRCYVSALKEQNLAVAENKRGFSMRSESDTGAFAVFFGQRGFRAAFDQERRAELANEIAAQYNRSTAMTRRIAKVAAERWKVWL